MKTAEKLVREVQRMSAGQALKYLRASSHNMRGLVESLVRKRHARRTRRQMQKASRKGNRP